MLVESDPNGRELFTVQYRNDFLHYQVATAECQWLPWGDLCVQKLVLDGEAVCPYLSMQESFN